MPARGPEQPLRTAAQGPIDRHRPEVPKFVFMAVCFETQGHAKSTAKLITISVGSPSTYILLNLKNSISVYLNKTPTMPQIWKCHHADSNNGRASASPAELFAAASLGIRRTELFPSGSFRVKQQGLVILYRLIILKSLGCLTFPLGWGHSACSFGKVD